LPQILLSFFISHIRYAVYDTIILYRRLADIILSSVTEAVIGYRKRVPVIILSGTICIEDFGGKIWVTPSSRVQRRVERVWFNLTKTLGEMLK